MFNPQNDKNNNDNDNINNETVTICPTSPSHFYQFFPRHHRCRNFPFRRFKIKEIIRYSAIGKTFVCPVAKKQG
jgi:hypothetical protein